ncbi:MAG: ABC transporter ATP-binding protein [Pseudaminobacter sp.]
MPISASEPILKVRDLTGGYRSDFSILRGANLDVRDGEVVCLIGPNGAGKSTLLKAICGGLRHLDGSITFRGKEILRTPTYRALGYGISYVPQGRRVFPSMTVIENLEMGAFTLRDAVERAENLQAVFDFFPILAERRNQLAFSLSGGEQQMLAIGRALMLKPSLLMLDEPSLGLSPKMASLVFDKLAILKEAGTTILFVEQQAKRGLRFADRGYVLVFGETRLTDSADRLLDNPEVQALYIGASAMGDIPASLRTTFQAARKKE